MDGCRKQERMSNESKAWLWRCVEASLNVLGIHPGNCKLTELLPISSMFCI